MCHKKCNYQYPAKNAEKKLRGTGKNKKKEEALDMKYNDEQKKVRMEETIKATKLLKLYCRKKGILLKDAAKLLGINANTVSKWMSGAVSASRKAVQNITDMVETEYPNLSKMEEDDVELMAMFCKYPTVNLNIKFMFSIH